MMYNVSVGDEPPYMDMCGLHIWNSKVNPQGQIMQMIIDRVMLDSFERVFSHAAQMITEVPGLYVVTEILRTVCHLPSRAELNEVFLGDNFMLLL